MKVQKKPTAFSNKVRKLLIEHIKHDIEDFDESKLVYGFCSNCGRDGYNSYVSIMYFYYLTDPENNNYRIYDIGYMYPQNELTGKLEFYDGDSQASICLDKAGLAL